MGTLYIVATPIGNLEDITIRAIKTLFAVDIIACEDTRRTQVLLDELRKRYTQGFNPLQNLLRVEPSRKLQLISYYDEVEEKRLPELIALLEGEKDIALVSDAGTPLIADPGFRLVRECVKRSIPVISIPGPSSTTVALTVSGLPANQFFFLGYLPEKHAKRKRLLESLAYCHSERPKGVEESHTSQPARSEIPPRAPLGRDDRIHPSIIFFESPHRLQKSLDDIKEIYGEIEIVIARELTKIHEEIIRGKISEVMKNSSLQSPKGEFVVLLQV